MQFNVEYIRAEANRLCRRPLNENKGDITMIKLIVGLKGTGKTKTLIADVNKATEESKGSVVCIEFGRKLNYEIKPQARLIDAKEFGVANADSLYGFVCGILAGNYDVTDLFIDSALKICGEGKEAVSDFEKFVIAFDNVADKNINIVMTASIEEAKLPESLRKFL